MIEQIIMKLKEKLIQNKNSHVLYEKYLKRSELSSRKSTLEAEINSLITDKEKLEAQLSSYNWFEKKFLRIGSINDINKKIVEINNEIATKEAEIKQIETDLSEYNLDVEELGVIEEYVVVLDLEKDYFSARYNEVIDGLLQIFDSSFINLITFCKENSISLNFKDYDDEEKANAFGINFMQKFKKMEMPEKYSDLSQLCIVRKVKMEAIPKGDMVIPALSVDSINKVGKTEIIYDGEKYEDIEFEHPSGYLTLSWYLNACVADHQYGSWSDCDVVIIQPMNEKLYNDAAGLNPVDIIFENVVELENYFVVCDSEEKKKEIEILNKDVTVFVLKQEDYDYLPSRLGYYKLFEDYAGQVNGNYRTIPELYDLEFLKRYPKFVTHNIKGPNNTIHNLSYIPKEICRKMAEIDFVINMANREESFEDFFKKFLETFSSSEIEFSKLHKMNISIEQIFVQGDKKYTSFLSKLIAMDNIKFNPEVVFNLLIDGVTITEENMDSLLKIKEEVILTILKYNAEVENKRKADSASAFDKRYENLIYRLFTLRKLVFSNAVNKKTVFPINYEQILEYCDFSKLGEICNNIVYSHFNKDRNTDVCLEDICDALKINIARLSTEILNFKLVREQNSINDFVDKFLYISKIKDENKMTQEIYNIFGDLLNENCMNNFRTWAKKYSSACDLETKLLFLSLPITNIMFSDLNRQENNGIKR